MAKRPHVMLIIETSLVYGRAALRGISRYLVEHQPWSLYLDLRELMVDPPAWLDTWDGDGVISRSTTPAFAEKLRRLGKPCVDLTDIYGDQGLPHIWTNHVDVGRMAAAHLLERGFRQFAFCGFSGHDWSAKRREGFRAALADVSCTCSIFESPWEATRTHSWEEQQHRIGAWLQSFPKPIGVMACNDMRGQHVLDACRRQELAVPEEAAVIGVDDDELVCGLCDPPLSSVKLNPERVGFEAAAMLDQLMRGKKLTEKKLLVSPLGVVPRQSTDVLAIDDSQVAAAVRIIRQRACDGITVDDVLQQVPMSRSVLERRFRRYLKRSPQEEIRSVQLKRIKQLLAETDLPLEKIATLTGFTHPGVHECSIQARNRGNAGAVSESGVAP